MSKKRYAGALAIVALGFALYWRPAVDPHDVPGVYRWDQKGVNDVIDVRPNGTYVHTFTPHAGVPIREEGTWEFEAHGDEDGVTFNKFRFYVSPQDGREQPATTPGFWSAVVDRGLNGRPRLGINYDLGLYYVR